MQLIHGAKQRSLQRRPTWIRGTSRNAPYFFAGQPGLFADGHVMAPLIFRPAQPPRAQDSQLALPHRQRRLAQNMIPKHQPSAQQSRMARQGAENVEHLAITLERGHRLLDLAVPLGGWRWRNPRLIQSHGLFTSLSG